MVKQVYSALQNKCGVAPYRGTPPQLFEKTVETVKVLDYA